MIDAKQAQKELTLKHSFFLVNLLLVFALSALQR